MDDERSGSGGIEAGEGSNGIVVVPSADGNNHHQETRKCSRYFHLAKRGIWMMVASLVIIVCLVVIFGVQPGSGREQSFREIPEQETFDRRRYIFFRSALAHVSEPATFVNPNSPQSQALRWLVYEDQTISVPDGHQDLQSITAIDGDFQLRLTQRYALMVLAFSTNGALWRGIYPWERQFETMECDSEFKGVECDNKTGEVSKIDLATRNLGGTIPDELGLLTKLTYLDLSRNLLEGRIPYSLWQLTNLKHLALSHNDLAFTISSSLEKLTQLERLVLSDTYLQGRLPDSNLTSLKQLVIANTQLSGPIFNSIPNWPNLEVFLAENSRVSGEIPTGISDLANLRRLGIQGTKVQGTLPTELGLLEKLEVLTMGGDFINGTIPSELGNLSSLNALMVTLAPKMTGTLPTTIGNLSRLTFLAVTHTSLTGSLPSELGLLTSVSVMNFETNGFSGMFPSEFSNMQSLHRLQINSNYLTGTVSRAFCDDPSMVIWLDCLGGLECENDCCPESWCYF